MKYLIIVALTLVFYSCSEGDAKTEKQNQEIKPQTHEAESNTQQSESAKWIANSETAEGMAMMKQIIANFWETSEDNRNYAMIGEELSL